MNRIIFLKIAYCLIIITRAACTYRAAYKHTLEILCVWFLTTIIVAQ